MQSAPASIPAPTLVVLATAFGQSTEWPVSLIWPHGDGNECQDLKETPTRRSGPFLSALIHRR